jgi:thioredoxin 2
MNAPVQVVCAACDTVNRVPRQRLADGAKCGRCKHALFDGHPLELRAATFDRHLSANQVPVIVDFWAPWCAPCRMMAPAFEQAAAALAGNARLAKLDTEAEPAIAARFGIRSIPTLVAFRDGHEIARQSGALDVRGVLEFVNGNLN